MNVKKKANCHKTMVAENSNKAINTEDIIKSHDITCTEVNISAENKTHEKIKSKIKDSNIKIPVKSKRRLGATSLKEIDKSMNKKTRILKGINTIKCEEGLLKTTIHKKFVVSQNYHIYAFYTPQKKEFTINFFEHFLYTKFTDNEIIKLKFVSNDLLLIVYETKIELMSIFNQKIELCIKEKNLKNAFYLKSEQIIILEKKNSIIHIHNEQRNEYPKKQFKIINSLIYLNYQNILKEYDLFMNELQRFSCYRINDFWMFEGFLFTLSSNQLILANIEPILDVKASNLFVNEKYIFTYLLKNSESYELQIFEKTEFVPKLLKSIVCSSYKILNKTNIVYLFDNKLYFNEIN